MGVDFMVCVECENTFPDCGPHIYCYKCQSYFCDYCMEKKEISRDINDDDLTINCPVCTGKTIKDKDLLEFALRVIWENLKMSRAAIEEEFLRERNR